MYGRTSPDRNPPTAERYAQVMARIDVEYPPTTDAYARVIEQDDDSQSRQTARWSGGSPSRGRGVAPQTDTADRTQPRETARRGGEGSGGMGSLSVLGRDTLEGGVMSGELPLTYLPSDPFTSSLLSISFFSSFYSLCSYF
jgi:hypothetical protein